MKRFGRSQRLNRCREETLASSKADPQYPDIRVSTANPNPMVLVAVVRQAMRHAHVRQAEIDRFTEIALAHEDPDWRTSVCQEWVSVG
jgi:hypothetical protein